MDRVQRRATKRQTKTGVVTVTSSESKCIGNAARVVLRLAVKAETTISEKPARSISFSDGVSVTAFATVGVKPLPFDVNETGIVTVAEAVFVEHEPVTYV